MEEILNKKENVYSHQQLIDIYRSISDHINPFPKSKSKIISSELTPPKMLTHNENIVLSKIDKEVFVFDAFTRRKPYNNSQRQNRKPHYNQSSSGGNKACKWWYAEEDGTENGPHSQEAMMTLYSQLAFDSHVKIKNYSKMYFAELSKMVEMKWNTFFDENPTLEELKEHDKKFRKYHQIASQTEDSYSSGCETENEGNAVESHHSNGGAKETASLNSTSSFASSIEMMTESESDSAATKNEVESVERNMAGSLAKENLQSATPLVDSFFDAKPSKAPRQNLGPISAESNGIPNRLQSQSPVFMRPLKPHRPGSMAEAMANAWLSTNQAPAPQIEPQSYPNIYSSIGSCWSSKISQMPPMQFSALGLSTSANPWYPPLVQEQFNQSEMEKTPAETITSNGMSPHENYLKKAIIPKAMLKWCKSSLKEVADSNDLSLMEMCMGIDDMDEIKTHFITYYGDNETIRNLADQFIKQKQFHRNFKGKKSAKSDKKKQKSKANQKKGGKKNK